MSLVTSGGGSLSLLLEEEKARRYHNGCHAFIRPWQCFTKRVRHFDLCVTHCVALGEACLRGKEEDSPSPEPNRLSPLARPCTFLLAMI